MNAECKLVKQEGLGDHVIGEVTEISADENITMASTGDY